MINEEDQYKQINTPLRVFGSIMVTSAKVSTNAKADMAVEYQVQQELIHTTTHFKLHVSVSLFLLLFPSVVSSFSLTFFLHRTI